MIRCATIGTNFVADWFMKAVQACDGITCSLFIPETGRRRRRFAGNTERGGGVRI